MATQPNLVGAIDDATPRRPQLARGRFAWKYFRFRLRTLLLLPVVVVVLLLIAFPKLLTGDFVDAKVVSIDDDGNRIRIEMEGRISSDTGWGATLSYGRFGSLGTSGRSRPHWTWVLATWPRHEVFVVNLGLRGNLPLGTNGITELLSVKQGDAIRIRPGKQLEIAPGVNFRIWPGNRLGF